MNISTLEPMLRHHGVDSQLLEELRAAAAKLPPDVLDRKQWCIPSFDGLTEAESQVFLSRMLWKIAPLVGVCFNRPNLLDIAGFPRLEELLARTEMPGQVCGVLAYPMSPVAETTNPSSMSVPVGHP